jgi:hypothetical protein
MDSDESSYDEPGDTIYLHKLNHYHLNYKPRDDFLGLGRDNETVEKVVLCLPWSLADDVSRKKRYAFWDKVAKCIGHLQALREIVIAVADVHFDPEEALVPDWEILACILRRLRRRVKLRVRDDAPILWDTETLPAFVEVIRGHAMIESFSTGASFSFGCLDMLCSALQTVPALKHVSFNQGRASEGPEVVHSHESIVKLLQSPVLREVAFVRVVFTNTLCQAVAKALKERSEITDLRFKQCCSFPMGGLAVIASALTTNTTLKCLKVWAAGADEHFYEVLAAALLPNSTLQKLSLHPRSCLWLSPLFLALQVNKGLKMLSIFKIKLIDEKLSTAMKLGLGNNSTLETFKLPNIMSDNDTCLCREALSFLPINTALKTLHMQFDEHVTDSRISTIRMEVLAMLCENESLETLEMISEYPELKEYLKCVEAIQSNTTLKKLRLDENDYLSGDESKDLIPVLKKNYGLDDIPGLHLGAGDCRSILDLNRVGRRYLVQDGSSISKGVAVLSRVSGNINSVFLHLVENPRLCDRSAVEVSSSSIGDMNNAGSKSPGNRDKREQQATSHPSKETRRRLV